MMQHAEIINRVDSFINGLLNEKMDVYRASAHLISAGGKRLRPLLAVRFYESLGGRAEDIIEAAAAAELIHSFTLVHDDIMDNDDYRRGVPTVHKVYGTAKAILAGDLLFAEGYRALSMSQVLGSHPDRFLRSSRVLTENVVLICEGQDMDITPPKEFNEDFYYGLIRRKTSALFIASALIGVYASGKNEYENAARKYGDGLGIAFQIVDDLLGIVGDTKETGKPVGSDIREGKRTLPISIAINMADKELREMILGVYGKPSSDEVMGEIVERIKSMDLEEHVLNVARGYAQSAIDAIEKIPESDSKRSLEELVELAIRRKK
ncbi:MAG: polyprenyl synthetase family protein [Nitrososphaerota archaeon]|jgi:geranylgeranyl diphosphate synthase type I|nr:polyprenyl synthetase family protein [Nitrososphaerota archaeon]MDG6931652.1 polyprenyl synthetase family protein [Nitrososphaerota archaeon]MDG6936721.1 polyprenyl synthetase family protein [Nitrososphaerota archaeon]